MPEVRLIDSETVKSRIGELCINNDDMFSAKAYERIIGVIEAAPTIEAEPVRHAQWESWGFVFHGIEWKRCSSCGKCADVSYYGILDGEIKMSTPALRGCCGAKMDGGAENG